MTAFCLYVSRHSSAGRSSVASETKEAFPFPHFQRRNWMGLDGTLEGKKLFHHSIVIDFIIIGQYKRN